MPKTVRRRRRRVRRIVSGGSYPVRGHLSNRGTPYFITVPQQQVPGDKLEELTHAIHRYAAATSATATVARNTRSTVSDTVHTLAALGTVATGVGSVYQWAYPEEASRNKTETELKKQRGKAKATASVLHETAGQIGKGVFGTMSTKQAAPNLQVNPSAGQYALGYGVLGTTAVVGYGLKKVVLRR